MAGYREKTSFGRRAVAAVFGFCLPFAMLAATPDAHAGALSIKDGQWRFEVQGLKGTNIGTGDHSDDWYITGEVEYEMPFWQRWSVSAQVPVILVDQRDEDEGEDDVIVGAGFGIGLRVYQHAESRHGFFLEGTASAVLHTPRFEDNTSNLNFITGGGIGYKWQTGWHVSAQFQHISNGSLGSKNAGFNAYGLAVGKTF